MKLFGDDMSKYFTRDNGYKTRGNKGEIYKFGTETELLKLLFEKDQQYYRYVYNIPENFTPKFLPPKEVEKVSWTGKKYIETEEVDEEEVNEEEEEEDEVETETEDE